MRTSLQPQRGLPAFQRCRLVGGRMLQVSFVRLGSLIVITPDFVQI